MYVYNPAKGTLSGLSKVIPDYLKHGTVYDHKDGYLISARGNPITNVVRVGDFIILHTAGGKDLNLKPLKSIYEDGELSEKGEVAMVTISKHLDNMECYTCHADWAPQCYGCHIKVDFTQPCKKKPDWIAMGQAHDEHGLTADVRGEYDKYLIDGEVTETRSYLRWENPPLVMNGEHRISPAIPGCQTTVTVIGQNGKPLLTNHIFKIPNVEGADEEGQLGIDISPVQPHTVSKSGRECESCHTNPQSMGYGIEGGKIYDDPSQKHYVDLMDADGNVLTERGHEQMNAIPNLKMDWSRFVDEEGKQLQTVGHHFKGSRPLNNEERAALDRRGVCLSCHKTIPEGSIAIDLISHVKEVKGEKYDTDGHNNLVNKIVRTAAWAQVLAVLFILGLIIWFFLRRKKKWRR